MTNLAWANYDLGRLQQAIELATRALEMQTRLHGEQHPDVAFGKVTLAQMLMEDGQTEKAEDLLRDAVSSLELQVGPSHVDVASTKLTLANLLAGGDRLEEACPLGNAAYPVLLESLGDNHWRVAVVRSLVGACLTTAGDMESAEAVLKQSLDRLGGETGYFLQYKISTLERLVTLYVAWDRPADAERYRSMLAEAQSG
jgi:tetratricopeptide (TPR) repeat protein